MAATLPDELVEEIVIHITPEEPAHLFRAALVCRSWRRILSDHGFLRCYRTFGTTPLLGYIQNHRNCARFFPTSTACPVSASAFTSTTTPDCTYSPALDCRHGRVLIRSGERLIVWHPITGSQQHLSVPPTPHGHKSCYSGSVLCATNACDHLDCGGGPFVVVFVWTWMKDAVNGRITWASIYSSETGAWSATTSIQTNYCYIQMIPGLLIADALYFAFSYVGLGILKYDLCKHGLSVINVPRLDCRTTLVMKGEGGGLLRLVTLWDNCIYVWSQQDVTNDIHGWVKNKVMDLPLLLPDCGSYTHVRNVIGSIEGTDIVFISTYAGIFTLNLKSRQVRKLCERETYYRILPYMSFYTPR